MAQILFTGDAALTATTNNRIDGIIPNGPVSYINLHNAGNSVTISGGFNPHIGDSDTISYLNNHPLEVGDRVTLHSSTEEYVGVVTDVDRPNGEFDVRIAEVLDPLDYTEDAIPVGDVGETTSTVTIALDSTNGPGAIPVGDIQEVRITYQDEDSNDGLILLHDTDFSGGHESLHVTAGNVLTVTFTGAGAAALAAALADLLDGTDKGEEFTGRGYKAVNDTFDIEIIYHDSNAITAFSFTKPVQVAAARATQYDFPISLPFTTSEYISVFSCGEGTQAIHVHTL